jgi:hypothetical protein
VISDAQIQDSGTGRDGGATQDGAVTPDGSACTPGSGTTAKFSFFLTSMAGILRLSGSTNGFGGDLRFGKSDGLAGADEICRQLAETGYPGAGCKTWRAFLSVTKGPAGTPVNAIDRVGTGPWYDRLDRVVAMTKDDLVQDRPRGGDPAIINDLPNEYGVPNHNPDGKGNVDNHTTITGTGPSGALFSMDWGFTCHDWTSKVGTDGTPKIGFSWKGGAGASPGSTWYTGQFNEAGCADYVNITDQMGPDEGQAMRDAHRVHAERWSEHVLAPTLTALGKPAAVPQLAADFGASRMNGIDQLHQLMANAFMHVQHVLADTAAGFRRAITDVRHGNAAFAEAPMKFGERR